MPVRGRYLVVGAPGAGKSTLITALGTALNHDPAATDWRLVPRDGVSPDPGRQHQSAARLLRAGQFPRPTTRALEHGFEISRRSPVGRGRTRELARTAWRFLSASGLFGSGARPEPVEPRDATCELVLADRPGRQYSSSRVVQDIVSEFESDRVDGIAFVYDPTLSRYHGDNQRCLRIVPQLYQWLDEVPQGGSPPLDVAFCISKIDEPAVFSVLRREGLIGFRDQSGAPFVSNAQAAFELLVDDDTRATVAKHFRAESTAFFPLSSVGFFSRGDEVDPDDCFNVVAAEEGDLVRGLVRPVGVAAPFLWLGSRLLDRAA